MPDTYDFEIYFFGLICIHGLSEDRGTERKSKIRAMLLTDVMHRQRIYLNDDKTATELDPNFGVSFGNLPGGAAQVLPSFDTLVPHLEDVTDDMAFVPVTLNKYAPGTKVKLPGGLLATVDQYDYEGEYYLNNDLVSAGCIGRVTLLQVTTVRPEVIVYYNNTSTRVRSDGWILIANMETVKNDGVKVGDKTERPDFQKHAGFLNAPPTFATLYELDDERCTTPISNPINIHANHLSTIIGIVKQYPVFNHPECSNTNWP